MMNKFMQKCASFCFDRFFINFSRYNISKLPCILKHDGQMNVIFELGTQSHLLLG
jgi:hypothetical protein